MAFPVIPPPRAFLVCATPRSGSTLLCETLRASGVAGRPEEPLQRLQDTGLSHQPRDYFRGVDDPELLALLPERRVLRPIDGADARERLELAFAEDTTENGVFGTKLMWGYLPDALAGFRAIGGAPDGSDAELLAAAFGDDVRYLHVRRRDKLGQAISLWKAIQLQSWRDEEPAPDGADDPRAARTSGHADARRDVAEYHAGAIAHLRELLTAHEAAWAAWFAEQGVVPLRTIDYEDLVPRLEPIARDVLDALGIEEPPAPGFATPRLRRQSDELSARWRARFLEEHPGLDVADEERAA